MNLGIEIQAVPESTGPSFKVGFKSPAPWAGQDELPEASDKPPRVRAIKALLYVHSQAKRLGECHNSELEIMPHEEPRMLCSFVHLSNSVMD